MYDNIEQAFQDLDKKEYWSLAKALAAFRKALLDQGFTRREAARIVESYLKFVFDFALDAGMHLKMFDGNQEDETP